MWPATIAPPARSVRLLIASSFGCHSLPLSPFIFLLPSPPLQANRVCLIVRLGVCLWFNLLSGATFNVKPVSNNRFCHQATQLITQAPPTIPTKNGMCVIAPSLHLTPSLVLSFLRLVSLFSLVFYLHIHAELRIKLPWHSPTRKLNNIKSSSESDSRSESGSQSNSGRQDLHSWRQVA